MKFRRSPDNDETASVEWIEASATDAPSTPAAAPASSPSSTNRPLVAPPAAPTSPAAPTTPPVMPAALPTNSVTTHASVTHGAAQHGIAQRGVAPVGTEVAPSGGVAHRAAGSDPARPVSPPSMPGQFGQPDQPPTVARGSMLPPTPPPSRFGEPVEPETPAPAAAAGGGWGWRALAAFIAGGVVAGGSFAAASYTNSSESAGTVTVAAAPATNSSPGPVTPPVIVEPPDLDTDEPAAFVANLLGPSVVQIEIPNFGLGSGVVYGDGLIITNEHVVGDATEVDVRTSDGRVIRGEVLGGDERTDIAVVSVGPGSGLPAAQLATGVDLEVGQSTIAIGSPFQLQQTVTSGIISAVNRPIFNGVGLNAMIQTDAAINPGNSGGALADRTGRVIGINTSIQTDGTGNSNIGVGFAVPIDTAVNIAERIVAGDPMTPGFLGVSGAPTPNGDAGVSVTDVTAGSAAERAGLQIGDRIVSIDGAPVTAMEELAGLVQTKFPGDEVELMVFRDGQEVTVAAVLGER